MLTIDRAVQKVINTALLFFMTSIFLFFILDNIVIFNLSYTLLLLLFEETFVNFLSSNDFIWKFLNV